MNQSEIVYEASEIIEKSGTAVLANVDKNGFPVMRWMSPVFLKGNIDSIYALTSPKFGKSEALSDNPRVQWLIQTAALERIITLKGTIQLIDNVSLRSELIESIGSRLRPFWQLNNDTSEMIVLETVIEEGLIFYPVKGRKERVVFKGGA